MAFTMARTSWLEGLRRKLSRVSWEELVLAKRSQFSAEPAPSIGFRGLLRRMGVMLLRPQLGVRRADIIARGRQVLLTFAPSIMPSSSLSGFAP